MSVSEKQREQQSNLQTKLWDIANDLRGSMEANEVKNYILGLIFYRYLSKNVENRAKKLLEEDNISYEEAWQDEEYKDNRPVIKPCSDAWRSPDGYACHLHGYHRQWQRVFHQHRHDGENGAGFRYTFGGCRK